LDEEHRATTDDWSDRYPQAGRADELGEFPGPDGGAHPRADRTSSYGEPDPYQHRADAYQQQADPYQHLVGSYGRPLDAPQHRSSSYDDQSDAYHHGPDFLDEVTGPYTPYAESLDDLPAPVGDPLTGPIPGLTPAGSPEPPPMTGRADDNEPDWYAPLGARRTPADSTRADSTRAGPRWDETQPHDWSQHTGWDLLRHREAGSPGEATTPATAVPAGMTARGDVPSQARRRPDYDEYPADLRPRRSNPGALAGRSDTRRSSPPAGADRQGRRGYDDRDSRYVDEVDWTEGHPGRKGWNGHTARSTHTGHSTRTAPPPTRTAQSARPGRSTYTGHPTYTGRSTQAGRGLRRRRQHGRMAGLPAPLAVAVALTGALGSAFLDLVATGGLGVLFSVGFVMTSFGVAAGIRRSDVFTAGVMPPLAALATFVAVGVAAPDRLSNMDNASPVIAVLAGLASESWTLVAASALALGTVALRVALGYRELSQDEPSEGPSAAQVAGRRSGSRPRS
jgi:hypothetical protein